MNQTHYAKIGLATTLACVAMSASAQSAVTIYGAIDTGLMYQSNQASLGSNSGGKSVIKETTGVWYGSRLGFKGTEDLGSGYKALFLLEAGFNGDTGGLQYNNTLFGRQGYVGVSNADYGSLMLGRQYTAYYQMLAQYGPTTYLSGAFGAHPGDLDGLDTLYRANNTILYMSPTVNGVTFSGSYSLGEQAGSTNRGSTLTAGIKYSGNPLGLAAGYSKISNATPGGGAYSADSSTIGGGAQPGVSAVTNGYQTAESQQRAAVEMGYIFNNAWDMSAVYSNVKYTPGSGSSFRNAAIFNTGAAVLHWKPSAVWDFAVGYSYTRATQANGINDAAKYHQLTLTEYYTLSSRTSLYAGQTYQRANGQTLGTAGAGQIINATASAGDFANGTPSSSRGMFIFGGGLIHKF